MKKIALFATLLLVATQVSGAPKSPKHTISGHIEGLGNDSLVVVWADLWDTNYGRHSVHDSTIVVSDGRFVFDFAVPGLTYIRLEPTSQAHNRDYNSNIELMLLEGEKVEITGAFHESFVEYYATGSRLSEDYATLNRLRTPLRAQWNDDRQVLSRELAELSANPSRSEEMNARMEELRTMISEGKAKASYPVVEYVRDNPDSELSAMVMEEMPADSLGKYFPLLSERVRATNAGSMMYSLYERWMMSQKFKGAKVQPLAEGMEAPAFTLRTDKGAEFSLADIAGNGKWVVIDFWTHTCNPCRAEMPRIRECYEKHGDRVEFINIIIASPESMWKNMIAEYGMEWTQLADSTDDPAVVKYNVQSFPTKVVLDPQHRVAKIFVGATDEFYKYMDEL
ncbi:AhpC/TSA family protein [Alistipes sp. OttesenSCG-928-B03]|nr:AhpC/TSA family protein [Alistipes sp. OttesenSCG-928-B03]